MTLTAPIAAPSSNGPRRAFGEGAPMRAAWHAAWAVAAGGLALMLRSAGPMLGLTPDDQTMSAFAALLMAAPGLVGLGLLWRDDSWSRTMLLAFWCFATAVAAVLGGGLSGPTAALVFMPVAAAAALSGPDESALNRIHWGLAGAAAAAVAGLISRLGGAAEVTSAMGAPWAASVSALFCLAAMAGGLTLALKRREQTQDRTKQALYRAEAMLVGQPGLSLVLDGSGCAIAAYGAPPPALSVDPLFSDGLIPAVHEPEREAVRTTLERAITHGAAQIAFTPKSALDRRILLALKRVDGPGAPHLMAQALDGAQQHAREAALEAALAEAEALNAGKSRFLANMSHELRTPLNAVIGFSDIMRQRLFGPLPERYTEYADAIHEAGGHLLDLINDVLDVTRIEAARYELSRDVFDAREVISAAIALLRLQADDKGVELASVLPDAPLSVSADRRALKQMVLNLLSNAVKFTPTDGAVTVTAGAYGERLEIVVADTGVGVAPEDLKRLGRPFEQAGGAEQRALGSGLGLSLVRSLAELHDGEMTMESTLGAGTAVTLRLPVMVAEAEAA